MDKLVLFAPANPYCEMGRRLIAFYNTRVGSFFATLIPRMPRRVLAIAHRRVYGDPARATAAALDQYTRSLNRGSIEHILGIVRGWWADMAPAAHRACPCLPGRPVLLIWGDRDFVVGLSSGRRLAEVPGRQAGGRTRGRPHSVHRAARAVQRSHGRVALRLDALRVKPIRLV